MRLLLCLLLLDRRGGFFGFLATLVGLIVWAVVIGLFVLHLSEKP